MKFFSFKPALTAVIFLCITVFNMQAYAQDGYERNRSPSRGYAPQTYEHIYYPSHHAYFSPHSRTWFWRENSTWRSGFYAPNGINIRLGGIPIQLNTSIPYYEHRYVENRYPRPHYVVREQYRRRHHHDGHRGDHHPHQGW